MTRIARRFSLDGFFKVKVKQVLQENETGSSSGAGLRWVLYLLIIAAASAAASYRIWHVNAVDAGIRNSRQIEGSPLLCANDRSRWCTIRALGDHNQYEIDQIIADPKTREFSFDDKKYNRYWATIDLVKHRDRDGEMHYYSSKPTLFPTMLASLYKGVKSVTRKDLENDTFEVVRIMLVLVNVIPMALFLLLMAATLEILSNDTFTKLILLVAASFGTFLTPFTITLNNHLPAAFSVGITLFSLVHILKNDSSFGGHFFVAGIFSAFAAANELPALSFFCFTGLILLLQNWLKTLILFVPGAALVVAAFFVTNYYAHHDWIPPYAHRNDGAVIATLDESVFADVEQGKVTTELIEVLNQHADEIGFESSLSDSRIHEGQMPLSKTVEKRFVFTQSSDAQRLAIVKQKSGPIEIRQWNNWYEYPESRWLLHKKAGVDLGEKQVSTYAFHCLIGHHGIFSLTPLWLLSVCGMGMMFQGRMKRFTWIGVMSILISIVVVGFYLSRPLEDRNYGGGTSALRWLLWLAPLWIVCAVPFVEMLAQSIWGKIGVTIIVLLSIASAHYSAMNPWVHPWLYELLVKMDWIKPFGA